MKQDASFNPRWEATYRAGEQLNLYPYDWVVKHFNQRFRDPAARHAVRVLEVGCGSANNLWFLARSGFAVTGIDASAAAISFAQERFAHEGLSADLRVADFTALPFGNAVFDVVLDRGGITAAPYQAGRAAVCEVARVLKPGGHFLFNPLSDAFRTPSAEKLADVGCCYSSDMVRETLTAEQWQIRSWRAMESRDMLNEHDVIAWWLIEAERN